MKKALLVLMLLVLPFGLAACFKKPAASDQAELQTELQGGIKVGQPNTLMAWIKSGKGVECEFITPEGDNVAIMALGEKVKMSGFPYVDMMNPEAEATASGYSLTDGEWMYIWSGSSGLKMNLVRIQALAEELDGNEAGDQPKTWEDMVQDWDEANISYQCAEKSFNELDFAPPADVEFADFTDFIEGMADMSRQFQGLGGEAGDMDPEALRRQAEELEALYGSEE